MTSTDVLDRSPSPTVTAPIVNFSSIQRDRVADLVRVVALGVVIVWHSTLSLFHRSPSGTLTMPNPIGAYSGLWLLTWLLQVMPLFFVVSGAVNADAWDRHRRRGGTPSSFARHRVARFLAPLGVLVALCVVVEGVARIVGGGPFLAHHLVILVPLWTLVLLVAYAPLTPLLQRGWDAYGFSLTAGLVGVVMVSDLVRFRGGVAVAGAVSTLGVWLIAYQLGWVYRAAVHGGVEVCRSTGRVLAMIGLFGLVISTNIAGQASGPRPLRS